MIKKDTATRDTFSFGLLGMRVINSFAPAPAIAHERLRQSQRTQASDTPVKKNWRVGSMMFWGGSKKSLS